MRVSRSATVDREDLKAALASAGAAFTSAEGNNFKQIQKKTVSHCPLNGSDGDCTGPDGMAGKCKLKQKPEYIILESVLLSHSRGDPPRRIRRKENGTSRQIRRL